LQHEFTFELFPFRLNFGTLSRCPDFSDKQDGLERDGEKRFDA